MKLQLSLSGLTQCHHLLTSHFPSTDYNRCLLPSLQITACEKIYNYLPNCQTQVDISDTLAVASLGLSTPLTTLSFLKLLPWPINTVSSSGSCSQSTFGDQFSLNAPESNFSPGPAFHLFPHVLSALTGNLSSTIATECFQIKFPAQKFWPLMTSTFK